MIETTCLICRKPIIGNVAPDICNDHKDLYNPDSSALVDYLAKLMKREKIMLMALRAVQDVPDYLVGQIARAAIEEATGETIDEQGEINHV